MKWLHKLLKGLSLTAVLFVFQACYGTPAGYPDSWEETVGSIGSSAEPQADDPGAEDPEWNFHPLH